MRFKINQNELNVALQNLVRNTDNKFFTDFKLITADELLIIQATNGEVSLEYKLKADVLENGILLVNARKITEIINKLDGVVEFTNGQIKFGKSKLKIETKKADNFVFCEEINGNYYEINTFDLIKGIKNRLFACSSCTTQVLSGICINQDEIVGCDGNILAVYQLKNKLPFETITISKKTAQEIINIFDGEKVNVLITKNKIIIKNNIVKFIGSIFYKDYPKYKLLITTPEYSVKINKDKLIKSLELLKLIDTNCQFIFDKNCLILKNNDNEVELNIDYQNENIAIWLDINYVLACLKNLNYDVVNFGFTAELSPCILKTDKETTMIMPIRKH